MRTHRTRTSSRRIHRMGRIFFVKNQRSPIHTKTFSAVENPRIMPAKRKEPLSALRANAPVSIRPELGARVLYARLLDEAEDYSSSSSTPGSGGGGRSFTRLAPAIVENTGLDRLGIGSEQPQISLEHVATGETWWEDFSNIYEVFTDSPHAGEQKIVNGKPEIGSSDSAGCMGVRCDDFVATLRPTLFRMCELAKDERARLDADHLRDDYANNDELSPHIVGILSIGAHVLVIKVISSDQKLSSMLYGTRVFFAGAAVAIRAASLSRTIDMRTSPAILFASA